MEKREDRVRIRPAKRNTTTHIDRGVWHNGSAGTPSPHRFQYKRCKGEDDRREVPVKIRFDILEAAG